MVPVAVVSLLVPHVMDKEEKRYDLPRCTNRGHGVRSMPHLPFVKKDNGKKKQISDLEKTSNPFFVDLSILCAFLIHYYRNFSVVSANNANTKAPIQKRAMTLDSCQPNCSKWWCSGAILKMRFLLRSL